MSKEIGKIENFPYEIKYFEWKIPDFFTIIETKTPFFYESPTFSVADTLWHMRLYQNSKIEFTELALYSRIKRKILVEYNFGLKRSDGDIKHFGRGIFKIEEFSNHGHHKIDILELMQQKSELMPDNVLTITCTLKLMTEITYSPEQTALDPTRHLMLISKLCMTSFY